MSIIKQKKALVFFSAGVGDSILLVPLINELKKNGYTVTGLFTSPYHCEAIFKNTNLFDHIEIKKSKLSFILFSIFSFKKFESIFINHFSYSISSIILSTILGKHIFTNYYKLKSTQSSKFIHFIEPKTDTHDALQNMFLFNKNATLQNLDFNLKFNPKKDNTFNLPENYIVIQTSSANNNAPYKNWPINHWLQLFKHLSNKTIVLLGDCTETHLNTLINTADYPNVISLIGKTNLSDVMDILYNSNYYIGLDSGLMHMAVALNKPTFTIWGASNPKLYGYEWMGKEHCVVSLHLPCSPCNSWLNSNISRVNNPLDCSDFKCIKEISVDVVINKLTTFFSVN